MAESPIEEESVRTQYELPALSPEAAEILLAGPFGTELHNLVVHHATFLVFGTKGPDGSPENLHNATCFFVQTPTKLFAVTARHVIDGYRQAREERSDTICQIGSQLRFDPIDRMIGAGTKADIATFDITPAELERIGKRPITLWPPEPPDVDDKPVLFAGFPAAAIRRDNRWTLGFGTYSASSMAQRVTDWQLSCTVEWDNIMCAPGFKDLPSRQYDIGGMSGGPMLSIRERGGLMTCPLAGVISEGRRESDTIIAERADFIRPDGTIRV